MVVIDVGANVGQYTLLGARRVGPAGQVHAFEPIPANYAALVANVRNNAFTDRVRANQAALWNQPDTLTLYLDAADVQDNRSDYTVGRREGAADVVSAPALALDEYARDNPLPRVDLIKLDIEGAELYALQGMHAILERHHPLLLLEINRPNCLAVGYEPVRIEELLRGYGYRFCASASPQPRAVPSRDSRVLSERT